MYIFIGLILLVVGLVAEKADMNDKSKQQEIAKTKALINSMSIYTKK